MSRHVYDLVCPVAVLDLRRVAGAVREMNDTRDKFMTSESRVADQLPKHIRQA